MLLAIKSLFASKQRVYIRFQGFGFDRGFVFNTQRLISELGLLGWMHVVDTQGIAIEVEGPRPKLEALIENLRAKASIARLTRMDVDWKEFSGKLEDFRVRNN